MLVTWREDSEKLKMTEKKMLETLLEALKDVERLDVYEEVNYYAGKQTAPLVCALGAVSNGYTCIGCSFHRHIPCDRVYSIYM